MTEHAAVIFVFFFLSWICKYSSYVYTLTTILFLGGYLLDYTLLTFISQDSYLNYVLNDVISTLSSPIIEGLIYGLTIGIKSCIMIFVFIWVRASFPRIRFDQLMSFSWTILLPIVIAFIVLIPCIIYSFDIIPSNISLL